jgi:hypothetical protein
LRRIVRGGGIPGLLRLGTLLRIGRCSLSRF